MLHHVQSESGRFEKFFILEKMDPFLGIAVGVMCAEEIDHDKEILDYFGSKPYIQAWSDSQREASKGLSKGNVRLQHDAKRPVGLLKDLTFDDASLKVRVAAQIVDENARNLLATGVLTGFSIGGDYVKRTPMAGGIVKYIANPSEVSVCDRPCSPNATFSAVKADGSMELRKFAPRDTVDPPKKWVPYLERTKSDLVRKAESSTKSRERFASWLLHDPGMGFSR